MDLLTRSAMPARVRDLVTMLGGGWLVFGLFLDGWAHLNIGGPDTFFTPWHAVLYSGFAAVAAWSAVVVWRSRRPGVPLTSTIPHGYGLTVVGVGVFGVGGGLDLLWHQLLGIEVAIDALVSPPHLVLAAGGALVLATGARTGRIRQAADGRWDVPALVSVVLTAALAAFFLIYTSAFAGSAAIREFVPVPHGEPGHEQGELPVMLGMAGYVVTTILLTVPLLYLLGTRARPPLVTVTALVATLAWLSTGLVGFPPAAVGGAIGATVGAVLADTVRAMIPPEVVTRWLPAVLGATVALVWSGHLAGLALADGVRWPVALWTGALLLSSGLAAGLAAILRPGARAAGIVGGSSAPGPRGQREVPSEPTARRSRSLTS